MSLGRLGLIESAELQVTAPKADPAFFSEPLMERVHRSDGGRMGSSMAWEEVFAGVGCSSRQVRITRIRIQVGYPTAGVDRHQLAWRAHGHHTMGRENEDNST